MSDKNWLDDWTQDLLEIGRYRNAESNQDSDEVEHTCETCRYFVANSRGPYGTCTKWDTKVHKDMQATCWE